MIKDAESEGEGDESGQSAGRNRRRNLQESESGGGRNVRRRISDMDSVFQIYVKRISGKKLPVDVKLSDTIGIVKAKISL